MSLFNAPLEFHGGGVAFATTSTLAFFAGAAIFQGIFAPRPAITIFKDDEVAAIKKDPVTTFYVTETTADRCYVSHVGDFELAALEPGSIVGEDLPPSPSMLASIIANVSDTIPPAVSSLLVSAWSLLGPLLLNSLSILGLWAATLVACYLIIIPARWLYHTIQQVNNVVRAIPALLAILTLLARKRKASLKQILDAVEALCDEVKSVRNTQPLLRTTLVQQLRAYATNNQAAMNSFHAAIADLDDQDLEGHLAAFFVAARDEFKHISDQLRRHSGNPPPPPPPPPPSSSPSSSTMSLFSPTPNFQFINPDLAPRGFWAGGGYNSAPGMGPSYGG